MSEGRTTLARKVLYAAFDVFPNDKGAGVHIARFVAGLAEAGYEVHLLTAANGILPPEDSYLTARVYRLGKAKGSYLERALCFGKAVRKHLHEFAPYAVAHFRSIWSGVPLLKEQARYGYRTLFEVNGLPSVELKYHFPNLAGTPLLRKLKHLELFALSRAEHIVCPSKVTAAYIASMGIPEERITVIPNGVDTSLFAPRATPPGEVPTILYVGTTAPWQGLDTLLEAMPLILAKQRVRLRIIGQGRKARRKALRRRIRKLGLEDSVSLEDPLPHHSIPGVINQASVCVAPLGYNDRNVTQGCCPIKILEYAACGRPIVASDLPVVRELVRDGMEALLFSPDNPQDLANKVLTLLAEPELASALGRRALQRVRNRFTWRHSQEALLRVYESLLDSEADENRPARSR